MSAVEAKVLCLYRRRDIPENLKSLADKNQSEALHQSTESGGEELQKLKHRELFVSRTVETLQATHIRGKCHVKFHYDEEPLLPYLQKEDSFFFQLVYNPQQKTLQTDRSSIRLGASYQATIPEVQKDCQSASSREKLQWQPSHDISDCEFSSYLTIVRSLATMARAHHWPSIMRQPSLSLAASSACRDCTLQLALDALHRCEYKTFDAIKALCPGGCQLINFDELDNWSAYDGNLFEEALEKYGKNFVDIQSDVLHWKSVRSIVNFYYMWKTTDNYVQQKKLKAIEAEYQLKQVYIPNFNKPQSCVLYSSAGDPSKADAACDSCDTTSSSQWFALGPSGCMLKVCCDCWSYWKRYGDLKKSSVVDKLALATAKYVYKCSVAVCSASTETREELRLHLEKEHAHSASSASAMANCSVPVRVSFKDSTAIFNGDKVRDKDFVSLAAKPDLNEKNPLNFQLHVSPAWKLNRRLNKELLKLTHRLCKHPFSPLADRQHWLKMDKNLLKDKKGLVGAQTKSKKRIDTELNRLALRASLVVNPVNEQVERMLACKLKRVNGDLHHEDEAKKRCLSRPITTAAATTTSKTPKKSLFSKTQLFMASDSFKIDRKKQLYPPFLRKLSRQPNVSLESSRYHLMQNMFKEREDED
ncbi:Metastasis-associated protein mta2 [Cichlidogyrus casuarinus]|uniref:Metastasis-associated protein mta2 n=1 Tax=Cichlidogyrus casuarinus TaxID=1844966 RepID=A0ABD2Q8L7_9PLAT